MRLMRRPQTFLALAFSLCALLPARADAVQQVFDPAGPSFYDMPFPMELRRDPDGSVSLAAFPFPSGNALIDSYETALERTRGFGLNSGVFFKFDGDIDVASLPANPAASRDPGSSVFLINIEPGSKRRGERVPLWQEFRSVGDAWRDDHLLAVMPVPGHPLEEDALYAAVVTDALLGDDLLPVTGSDFVERMKAETPQGAFETSALPLYQRLWKQLETAEGMTRDEVVSATVFRTGEPTAPLFEVAKHVRRKVRPTASNLTLDAARSNDHFWVFTGSFDAPQFQIGDPPFTAAGSGRFSFDSSGAPVVQRIETLQFVLAVPKDKDGASLTMPKRGWPIVPYMHGTGGSRNSFINDGTASRLASLGIASLGIDQPLHGLRLGATPDGTNFYNPLNPDALRDNPIQAATDSMVVDKLVRKLRVPADLIGIAPGAGFALPADDIRFDKKLVGYMGHSQGATTGPLYLAVSRNVRGGVISAGGGHLLVNILTREQEFFAGLKLRELVAILIGGPVDLFHPALHLLQMGSEVSEPVAFAPYFKDKRRGAPLSLLFTHGTIDGYVTTPMTAAMVAAARYPLVEPLFAPWTFPLLPGYSYEETFDLAGLAPAVPPVTGNLGKPKQAGTGGMTLYENQGHFPVRNYAPAIAQWTEFMRSLFYEETATIPVQP
jgi:hypothetical protein